MGRSSLRAARAVECSTTPARSTSKRSRGYGAPRSASAPSDSPRWPTSRCVSLATTTSIAIARPNRPSCSRRNFSRSPVPMARVVFQCSGSEANDTAIKLAWYYWDAVGQPQRTKIISRRMAYHGNTCASVSLSGKPDMHAGFGLPFSHFKHTEFPHYYRRHEAGESEVEFSTRMAEALEILIRTEGPETIAAFFAEPVMGAGGAILPPQNYFEKIQEVLRKYDILLVADEVICGFARTGEMWGSQTYGLRPDMVTSAKALSAAMQPISAVFINDRIHEAMLAQSD